MMKLLTIRDCVNFNTLSKDWLVNLCTYLNEKYGTDYEGDMSVFSRSLSIKFNYPNCYICRVENEINQEQLDARLLSIVDKYCTSIDSYKAMYNELNNELTTLKNKSVTKFNDTPTQQGDYSTDKYTSTITTNESETDYDINTKINILNLRLKGIVSRFIDQFEGFIIYE